MQTQLVRSKRLLPRTIFLIRAAISLLFIIYATSSLAKKLEITSNPTGAKVHIDGQYVGDTPLFLQSQGRDVLGSKGVKWKNAATLTVARSGCTTNRTAITPTVLESKNIHVDLECYRSHLQAGYQFLLKGQFEASAREYERALDLAPDQFEGTYNLAVAYMRLAKYQDSKHALDRAIKIRSDVPEVYNIKGLVCANLSEHDDSIVAFKEVLRLKPDFPMVNYNLASEYRLKGLRAEAMASIEKAIQLKSDFAEAYSVKARILDDLGRTKDALATAQQAFDMKPISAEANLTLSWELNEAGQAERAITYAQNAVQFNPDLPKGFTYLCRAHNELGNYIDALRACQDALTRNSNDAEAIYYRAIAYENLGQTREALISYRQSAAAIEKIAEPDAYLFFIWGNDCYRLGRPGLAVDKYRRAIQINSNFAPAHLNIGVAYLRLGRKDAAMDEYDALKIINGVRAEQLQKFLAQQQSSFAVPSSSDVPVTPDSKEGIQRKELLAEIAQVRASISANRTKSAVAEAERGTILERNGSRSESRLELQHRAEAIVNQISTYEPQVDQELVQAAHDQDAAQRSTMVSTGSQDTMAAITSLSSVAAKEMSMQSAEKHRQRANQLLAEIDRLSRELYVLTKPQ